MRKAEYIKAVLPLAFFSLIFSIKAPAQDSLPCIDVSKISFAETITSRLTTTYIDKNISVQKDFSSLQFKNGVIYKGPVPPAIVSKKAVIRFDVCNTSDSVKKIYFFPGFFFSSYKLYSLEMGLESIDRVLPQNQNSIGYSLLSLPPGDTSTIVAELFFEKTYNNHIKPRLINPAFLQTFISELRHTKEELDIMTYIFCGLLLMMIFFSIANYLLGASPEFLYYSGYAFLLGLMLFTKTFYGYQATSTNFFLETYLDFILQCVGIIFYMIFMQKFLEVKKNFPFLHKLYNTGIAFLVLAILLFSYFHFFTNNFSLEYTIETLTKLFLLLLMIVFIVYSLGHWKNKLLRYLVWGNLSLFIFSLISQLFISFNLSSPSLSAVFNSSLFYYEFGLLLELVFFLMGLSYKNRRQIIEQTRERERLKAENQMNEYGKELAIYKAQQEERNRISVDMHDELGSGMTAIRLMSEIAKSKMKENTPREIDKISDSANELLNKMNAIIWSMNSQNDTVDNLVSYIRTYTLEYFENTPIIGKVITPDFVPHYELSGDKRRNIFMCVKESLNNVVKHSRASVAQIDITCDEKLVIRISDNGAGIDMQHIRQFGNGLHNITHRMKSICGTFSIQNNKGTVTTLELPLI